MQYTAEQYHVQLIAQKKEESQEAWQLALISCVMGTIVKHAHTLCCKEAITISCPSRAGRGVGKAVVISK